MRIPRRDARLELQRRLEEEAAQRPSLLIVVRRLAAGRREADGAQHAAVVTEFGRRDHAVGGRTPFAVPLLERQRKTIVRLQIVVEVDVARENVRERERQLRAFACRRPWPANSDGVSPPIVPDTWTRARASSESARARPAPRPPRSRRGSRAGTSRRQSRTRRSAALPRACARARTAAPTSAGAGRTPPAPPRRCCCTRRLREPVRAQHRGERRVPRHFTADDGRVWRERDVDVERRPRMASVGRGGWLHAATHNALATKLRAQRYTRR